MTQSHARISAVSEPEPAHDLAAGAGGWDSNAAAQSQCRVGGQSAVDLPFLSSAAKATQPDRIAKAKGLADRLEAMALDTTAVILPAYVQARDLLDVETVGELGGRVIGAVGAIRGGRSALAELVAGIPRTSTAGSDLGADLDLAALDQRLPRLDLFVERLEAEAVATLTPHRFHGAEVGAAAGELGEGGVSLAILGREVQRTAAMIDVVTDLRAKVVVPGALAPARLAELRRTLEPWAARPLDLAFLRAALGPVWDVLDADWGAQSTPVYGTPAFLPAARPSDLLEDATKRAQTTGWLGDTGRFDIEMVHFLVMGGDKEGALFALRQLYSADRASRPKLLAQLARRGDLDRFCDTLGSDAVRALHDDTPESEVEVRKLLQAHFSAGVRPDPTTTDPNAADLGMLPVLLADADKETAGFALDELFELSRERRTEALVALHRRGRLDPLLENLGWAPIKELHDSLAGGYAELKKHIQPYFIGRGKFGPSLASEWEDHESSLHSLVGRIPYAGKPLNVALDVATFGFNSSYGAARDANTRGETSDGEFARTRNHVFARTALMAAVSLVTGGAADKFARGAGASATLAGIA
ncbi:MAG: hypothetical protein ABMB14_27290, partial [Myxococcota bacterium]